MMHPFTPIANDSNRRWFDVRSNENFPGSGAGRLLKILRGLVNRIHDSAGDTIKPAPRRWRAGIPEVTG
ncbi:MAG: hypothetical protein L0H12_01470, partial [Nitrosospira sp.]|nr:hypothetical protein [Nitrosospira sp.]